MKMSFSKWVRVFLSEKGIYLEEVLEVEGKEWGVNYMPVGVLVEFMDGAPKHEQAGIKSMMVKLDFHNAPIEPYLVHLAKAIAR
jgi:hypothetical protein